MPDLLLNYSFWPSFFAFLSVFLAATVLIEFGIYTANRYRERFLQEAGAELDDILLQMPAGRILDLSLALSFTGAVLTLLGVMTREQFSLQWALFLTVAVAGGCFPLPRLVLRCLKKRRLQKFNIQLEEALGMISSSLKAGFSINQALDEVAAQNFAPASVEFRLLTQEIRLGVPLEQALENMNRRLESDDFELVTCAILTARQTGGELTGTLERVAALIRERVRISNKLRALTAMGRLQAVLIGSMPFFLLFALNYVAPQGMMSAFFDSPFGIAAIILVVVLDVAGFLVIRRITTIEV